MNTECLRKCLHFSVEGCVNRLSIKVIEAIEGCLTSPAVHEATAEFVSQYIASYYHHGKMWKYMREQYPQGLHSSLIAVYYMTMG